jgi:hypothetical protein
LGGLRVSDFLEDTRSQGESAHTAVLRLLEEPSDERTGLFGDVDVERLEFCVGIEGRFNEVRTLEDTDALAPAKRALVNEASQPTHTLM